MIRHRAASERLCQSRYSGAVSDPGLVFDVHQTQPPQHFLIQPALFVVHGGRADGGDAFRAVYELALGVAGLEALVAACLDVAGDLVQGLFPADSFHSVA